MEQLILDAGPLITVCKFTVNGRLVIDHLLDHCKISIASSVYDEVVEAGAHYPDAQAAYQRVENGRINVLSPPIKPRLEAALTLYNIGKGECDSILLAANDTQSTAVLDDHLAYLVSDRLTRQQRFLLDVFLELTQRGALTKKAAIDIVRGIRERYPSAFVEHTLMVLRR